MDYPCGKFGDCIFSHFGSIMQTNRYTDADECYTPVTLVGVSKNVCDSLFDNVIFRTLQL